MYMVLVDVVKSISILLMPLNSVVRRVDISHVGSTPCRLATGYVHGLIALYCIVAKYPGMVRMLAYIPVDTTNGSEFFNLRLEVGVSITASVVPRKTFRRTHIAYLTFNLRHCVAILNC